MSDKPEFIEPNLDPTIRLLEALAVFRCEDDEANRRLAEAAARVVGVASAPAMVLEDRTIAAQLRAAAARAEFP